MTALERVIGAVVVVMILLDVFLTVLYARMGTGIISRATGKTLWKFFLFVSARAGTNRRSVLSFCGPVILVALLVVWAVGLIFGAALIIHPALGTGVRASSGPTSHDFMTALLAGGSALSVVGSGNFSPQSGGYKVLYIFLSFVGLSVTSLTLTYLMQVYTALQRRNALGLRMHLLTAETNDSAEMVAGLGPEGQFSHSYSVLDELGADMSMLKESHHFYPVLFYFRFDESYYSVSQFTLLAMDAISLIRSALEEEKLAWLQESGATTQLWRASMILAKSLEQNFIKVDPDTQLQTDPKIIEQWRRRYDAAVDRLKQAHIPIVRDPRAGFEIYRSLRSQWDAHIAMLAPALGYEMSEIDPAETHPRREARRAPFAERRHAAG